MDLNEVYMTGTQDKDEFCDLVRTMYDANGASLDFLVFLGRSIATKRSEQSRLARQAEQAIDNLQAENRDLKNFIYEQSGNPDRDEIRSKAAEVLGLDEYLGRCIIDDRGISPEDREYIADRLREGAR